MKSLSSNACKCIKNYKAIKDEFTFLQLIFFVTFKPVKTKINLFLEHPENTQTQYDLLTHYLCQE